MSRPLLPAGCVLMLLGCSVSANSAQPTPVAMRAVDGGSPSTAAHTSITHYLDEWFAVGSARCRLLGAERALSEPDGVKAGQLAEDIHIVDARFACEDVRGAQLSPSEVLANEARLFWLDERQIAHPPSTRTRLRKRAPVDHVLFEVAAHSDGLPRPRTYDARTGDPLYVRERRNARLRVDARSAGNEQRVAWVAPWPRAYAGDLDLFLERLARTLATGAQYDTLSETPEGRAALESAAELYAAALARFAPRELAVEELKLSEASGELTLALLKGSSADGSEPDVRFTLALSSRAGEPTVARMSDAARARHAISCSDTHSQLHATIGAVRERRAATALASGSASSCNALGIALPGACDSDPTLLTTTLRFATRCRDHARFGLTLRNRQPPADFAVQLRRGRALTTLSPSPIYTLAIDRHGQVTFAGEQGAASSGEGRTSPLLLGALYDQLQQLRYFERPGRQDGQNCKEGDERGDTLVIRAAGRERGVRDRDGCRGPFSSEELAALRLAIEHVAAVASWTAPSDDRQRDPDVWIVAAE